VATADKSDRQAIDDECEELNVVSLDDVKRKQPMTFAVIGCPQERVTGVEPATNSLGSNGLEQGFNPFSSVYRAFYHRLRVSQLFALFIEFYAVLLMGIERKTVCTVLAFGQPIH